jgi:hypothetical protein
MRTKPFSTLVVTAIVATACGGGGGGQQGEVADLFMDLASEEDIELDRDCVEEAAEGLSDDDAEKIVEAGPEGDPDVSPEADAIAAAMFGCVDAGSYLDSIISQFEDDDSIDVDCLRAEFDGLTTPEEIEAKVIDAALACSG